VTAQVFKRHHGDARSDELQFQFQKRSHFFIRTHNETFSVAMRVDKENILVCWLRHA
jgi:hypothetical protein